MTAIQKFPCFLLLECFLKQADLGPLDQPFKSLSSSYGHVEFVICTQYYSMPSTAGFDYLPLVITSFGLERPLVQHSVFTQQSPLEAGNVLPVAQEHHVNKSIMHLIHLLGEEVYSK